MCQGEHILVGRVGGLGRLPAGGMRASQGTFSSIELLQHEYLYTYENAFLRADPGFTVRL